MMESLSTTDLQAKCAFVKERYALIEERIQQAAEQSGRKREDIIFLAATKTVPSPVINYAISLGLRYLGENKVQELLEKYDSLDLAHCQAQFIGHLQTNKVKKVVPKVQMIQSIDSVKLAKAVSDASLAEGKVCDILLEVNIGKEENKSGVMPEALDALVDEIRGLAGVSIKGLMAIPPICEEKAEIRQYFARMHQLFVDMKAKKMDNVHMDILSMGMSDDYYEAILEGATMVRIGSALFGSRNYHETNTENF